MRLNSSKRQYHSYEAIYLRYYALFAIRNIFQYWNKMGRYGEAIATCCNDTVRRHSPPFARPYCYERVSRVQCVDPIGSVLIMDGSPIDNFSANIHQLQFCLLFTF